MNSRHLLLFTALGVLSVMFYVSLSAAGGQAGFPLDDAWIHQTYARSLAESGRMAYVAGQPSAGSTSPLWTLLLSAGYALRIDYHLWTYALGAVMLALCAWGVLRLSLRLWPKRAKLALAAGTLCVFEWHLGWAAASGMETLLYTALAIALIEWAIRAEPGVQGGLIGGALGGLLTVTRPEGLLLAGLAAATWLAHARPASAEAQGAGVEAHLRRLLAFSIGFAAPVAPAAWLNLQAGGAIFPNTFYAKQQEYAVYFSSLAAWLPRALDVIAAPFVGAPVLLAPGFALQALAALRRLRNRSTWGSALPIVWVLAHLAVYAARLPVTYQHGRYLMPVIPLVVLIGLQGSAAWIERLAHPRASRLARYVGVGSLIALAAAMWVIGAATYRADVDIIQNELVASARWLEANTPPDALVAAHDIGAIGYFTRRPLLDLAGLVSPEVIPVLRDEAALLELMQQRGASYFAAPPGFYTTLLDPARLERASSSASGGTAVWERVFSGGSPFTPEHWVVFRVTWQ